MVFENEVNLYGDAPIASKFSSQDTKFDVIQGHINAIISESEMIELLDGGKTMYSGMNDIKIDVTGLHGNISSLSTTVDGQTQQITEINSKQATYEASLEEFSATLSDTQSDLETTSQNLATLQLDTNRFKTTVSNTYSTKTQAQGYATSAQNAAISAAADDATSKANAAESNANAATDNKLSDYSTTSAVASMIQQESDNITLAVSRSYATKEEARTAAETTITGDTIYYLAYASNTGVNRQTSGWTPDPTASSAQISESKKYLWTYHLYTYGSGDTRPTDPIVTGTYGTQGATIDNTRYQQGSSPTNPPTGTWLESPPSVEEGKYLWTRVTYTDGSVSYSVAKQGQSGTSVTVSGTEYAYKLSENGTSPPTGTWSPTPVAPTSTQYTWTRTTTTFSDGSTAVTYTVGGKKGDTGVGISKVTPLYYAKNNNTAPAKPSSKITTTTINTGVWTTGLPSLTNTYKYLFTCDQIEYDDSSSHIEWTTVVENKNTAELYTRLTTAEQKITDDAIIQTVSASGQFPAKGDIILSINEVAQSQAYISADKINLTAYSTGAEVEEMANCDYVGDVTPTTSNYPASEWGDDDAKIAHIGDTYYKRSTKDKYYFKGIPEQGLLIRFDNRSETEQTHDYVYIYYRLFGNLYRSRKFSGSIGGATFYIPSGEFWVYWHSDTTVSDYYGFSFSALSLVSRHDLEEDVEIVSNLPNYYATVTNTYTDMASPHSPYLGGANKVWKYVRTEAISTGVFCSWVASAVKRNFDTKTTVMLTSNGLTSKVSAGDIASTINQTAQSVLIDAQKINLNGYLTVTDVGDNGSTIISGSRIRTGKVNADYVYGGTLSGSQIECSGYNYKTAITHASNGGFIRVYYRKTQTGIFETCGSIQGYDHNGNKAMIFNAGSGANREVSIECNEHYFTIDSSGVIDTDCHLGSSSSKSRFVTTEDYGERILYCYETPTPTFGDIGEGRIGDDGLCYIFIDPIFAETVTLNQYQVFLQKYGDGECYVSERKSDHFVVCGTVGLSFSWEIKAKQLGYDQKRLDYRFKRVANGNTVDYVEEADRAIEETETIDYAEEAINHINEIAEERKVA